MPPSILALLAALAAPAPAAPDSTFRREPGEPADAFAARVAPAGSRLAHPVVETRAWPVPGAALVAFYDHPAGAPGDAEPDAAASGVAFLPDGRGRYRRVPVGRIEPEGDGPQVRAVFLADAAGDATPELVVVAAWRQQHYDVSGTLYGTFVYALRAAAGGARFVHLEAVSRAVSGSCACRWRDGRRASSRFTTEAEVRRALRRRARGRGA